MAALSRPHQDTDYRRGVREVVRAHRTARIRRYDAASAGSECQLRLPDREELHSVPASDHLAALRPADAFALRRAQGRAAAARRRDAHHRERRHGRIALQHADRHRKYKESFRDSGAEEDRNRSAAQSELYVRHVYRGRMQPARTLGSHVRGGDARQQPVQPVIYIW